MTRVPLTHVVLVVLVWLENAFPIEYGIAPSTYETRSKISVKY